MGHSQVPREISVPNVETKVFRRQGARVQQFHNEILSDLLEFSPDLIVLFLGGNDIDASDDCALRVANALKEIIQILRTNYREVIFIEIEWRNFTRTWVPCLNRELYNQRRRQINRNVIRFCSVRHNRAINTSLEGIQRVGRDGVHFDSVAATRVITKIVNAITHALERMENL